MLQSCLWQASLLGLLPGIGRSLCYEISWVQTSVSKGNEDVKWMYRGCKTMCRAMLERECFCSLLLRAGLHWRVILESYPRATLPLSQWEHLTKPAGLVQGIGLKCGQCFQHDWWLVALHWGHGWNHSIRYTQKVAYVPCTVREVGPWLRWSLDWQS